MSKKAAVKNVFSKNKEAYITSKIHAQGKDLPLITKWLQPDSNMIALDIATGGGHVAKRLAVQVKTVFAIDIVKEMLANTAEHLCTVENIFYIIADAEAMPFLDNSFDISTCRIAAHHFPNPDKFISEVYRILKPGGKFLLIDNVAPEDEKMDQFINTLDKIRDYSHHRVQKVSEWKQLFLENKFTILKEKVRKKQIPYKEWVTRTNVSNEEIDKVKNYILQAPEEMKSYFQVKTNNSQIESFAIDEWIVLACNTH